MRKAQGRNVAYSLQLFSTAALRETPLAVKELHVDYIRAGCQVITTASYAVTRFYLDKVGEGARVPELAALSVRLAREAVLAEGAEQRVLVAASVPPLGESYQEITLPEAEIRTQYKELLGGLAGADILLCETMASLAEARLAAESCREAAPGVPIWVSFTPRRRKSEKEGGEDSVCLADGASVPEALKVAITAGAEAVLFNCATPEIIEMAIKEAVAAKQALGHASLPIGGYAHVWEEMDMDGWSIEMNESEPGRADQQLGAMVVRKDLSTQDYLHRAARWLRSGASIVGGCCGVGPEVIQKVGLHSAIGTLTEACLPQAPKAGSFPAVDGADSPEVAGAAEPERQRSRSPRATAPLASQRGGP